MEKKKIIQNWGRTGLLKGIKEQHHQEQVALLLENQRLMNEMVGSDHDLQGMFNRVTIPMIRRVYGRFLPQRIASVQTLLAPTDNIRWMDQYGNLRDAEIAAQTRPLQVKFPIKFFTGNQLPEGYIEYPGMDDYIISAEYESIIDEYRDEDSLTLEAHVVAHLSSKIETEISREVSTDLLKTAAARQVHIWQTPEHLADAVRIVSNRFIGRSTGNSANWLLTNPKIAEALSSIEGFDDTEVQQTVDNDIYFRGTLGSTKIYADVMFGDFLLVGFRGNSFQSGYIYAPYIPFGLVGEDTIITRYAKKLHHNDYYALISVENYQYEEEIELDRESTEVTDEQMAEWSAMAGVVDRKTVVMVEGKKHTLDCDHYEGRPLLGKVVALSRSGATNFKCDKKWACISISGSDEEGTKLRLNEENCVEVLRLYFDDVEFEREEFRPMSEEQANDVWAFVDKVWDEVDVLMVHCAAGISRSPAIAKAVSEKKQPEFADFFSQLYSPNTQVYKLMTGKEE